MPITALPAPPSRQDPTNFAVKADAFLGALPTFAAEANALQVDVNSKQTIASAAALSASASEIAASTTANTVLWNAATNYLLGQNAIDTVDFKTYRRKVAGVSATRPGLDSTNWQLLTSLGDVTLSGTQTITGDKTFSGVCVFSQLVAATVTNAQVAGALSDSSVLVPSGAVMYLARPTAPIGWLKANGALVSRTTYAALFAAIGTQFGAGDGTTTFQLPDLRGEFIRSWSDGSAVDAARAFGTFQDEAFKSHSHGILYGSAANTSSVYPSRLSNGVLSNVSSDAAGGTETRPRNIALLACIKF